MKRLFYLNGIHTYYGSGGEAGVRFVPTSRCRFMAEKAGLRFSFQESRGRACFDRSDLDKLKAYADDTVDPLILSFLVMAESPNFYNYTELATVPDDQLLMVTNRHKKNEPYLFVGKPLGKESLCHARSVIAEGVCTGDELMPPPVALVLLDYSKKRGCGFLEEAFRGVPQSYSLHFESRSIFLRYFIACDGDPETLLIEDSRDDLRFDFKGMMEGGGHRPYARFVSERPLALLCNEKGRFQLKCRESGRYRTILKALPNAPSDPLHSMEIDGRRVFVSDIFVHHYVHGR